MIEIIENILVDQVGIIYGSQGKIELIQKNGEMAHVDWYRQTMPNGDIREFNGKYVIEVQITEIDEVS